MVYHAPKLLKLASPTIVTPLTSVFMQSIRECRVYNNWKVARLTSVFKKDDPTGNMKLSPPLHARF